MKRLTIAVVFLSLSLLAMTGCGSGNTAAAGDGKNAPPPDGDMRMANADVIGEVISIADNKITINLAEMPASGNNAPPANGNPKNSGTGNDSKPGNDPKQPGTSAAPPKQGDPKQGDPKQGDSKQSDLKQDDSRQGDPKQDGSQPRMALQYTGETKTITLSDGISITTMAKGDNGGQQKSITAKDIKQGDVLQVWYSDKDKATVSRIAVMSPSEKP